MKLIGFILLGLACSIGWAKETLPLDEQEQQLVEQMLTAFQARDVDTFAKLVDPVAMIDRVAKGMNLTGNTRTEFIRGGTVGIRRSNDIMFDALKRNQAVTIFKFKHRIGDENRLLFRHKLGEENGYAFIDFVVNERGKIVDWFSYAEAIKASDAMRQAIAFMMNDKSLLSSIFGLPQIDNAAVVAFRRYSDLVQKQQFKDAFAALDDLPAEYKKLRVWASLRVTVAGQFDESLYRESLNYLADNFGQDPDLQFVLIDHYFYQQQMTKVIIAIDKVQETLNEDAELQYLACAVLKNAQQLEPALQRCQRALRLEPAIENAYWVIIDIGFQHKDAGLVTETLTAYEQAFDKQFDPDELAELDGYNAIADTDEYRTWAKERRAMR